MKLRFDKVSERVISFLMDQDRHAYDLTLGLPPELSDLDKDDFFESCRYLIAKKYCENSYNQKGEPCGIVLTHQLVHRKEFFWIDVREFLFSSVLIPVLVSVLTSGLVYFCAFCWDRMHDHPVQISVVTERSESSPEGKNETIISALP